MLILRHRVIRHDAVDEEPGLVRVGGVAAVVIRPLQDDGGLPEQVVQEWRAERRRCARDGRDPGVGQELRRASRPPQIDDLELRVTVVRRQPGPRQAEDGGSVERWADTQRVERDPQEGFPAWIFRRVDRRGFSVASLMVASFVTGRGYALAAAQPITPSSYVIFTCSPGSHDQEIILPIPFHQPADQHHVTGHAVEDPAAALGLCLSLGLDLAPSPIPISM